MRKTNVYCPTAILSNSKCCKIPLRQVLNNYYALGIKKKYQKEEKTE